MKNIIIALLAFGSLAFTKDHSTENAEVKWLTVEEAYAQTQVNPKPILIDVYTDWCGWCKKMDKTTYANAEIVNFLNDNYYAVKFDAEQKEDVTIMGHTFKFVAEGRRGYHELAAALLNGQMSYPSTVFLTDSFHVIQPIPGYLDAKGIEPILHFFATENFQSLDWNTFQKEFKSNID